MSVRISKKRFKVKKNNTMYLHYIALNYYLLRPIVEYSDHVVCVHVDY